jgi:hypothetical protein
MLTDALDQLAEHLRRLNRPVAWWLRPGISADQLPADLPGSVAQWFGWADGVESFDGQLQDDANVIPGYTLLSFDEAVRIMPAYAGDPVLGSSWLPLLTTAGADLYAAVWTPGDEAQVAGVVAGLTTDIEFASLEQMADVFNACFDAGVYAVDDARQLVQDTDRYEELYAEIVGR